MTSSKLIHHHCRSSRRNHADPEKEYIFFGLEDQTPIVREVYSLNSYDSNKEIHVQNCSPEAVQKGLVGSTTVLAQLSRQSNHYVTKQQKF